MTEEQAIHKFWNEFGINAYDENSVPEDATFPYITYNIATTDFGDDASMTASLWYRSYSWAEITTKTHQIGESIGIGGKTLKTDSGALWVKRGRPFSQRMGDPDDDLIRRVVLNIDIQFLTNN